MGTAPSPVAPDRSEVSLAMDSLSKRISGMHAILRELHQRLNNVLRPEEQEENAKRPNNNLLSGQIYEQAQRVDELSRAVVSMIKRREL